MKAISVYQKLKIASDLFALALKVKVHQLGKKYPEASQEEIKQKALELIRLGCR